MLEEADGGRRHEIVVYGPAAGEHILDDRILRIVPLPSLHKPAARAVITIQGETPVSEATITVDTTTGKAHITWVDDHGDTDAAPPATAVANWTSDNEAVLTIANDAANPLDGDITPVAEGTANISVSLTDSATGGPLMEADGVTPFPTPAPVAQPVTAGPAVLAEVSTEA